MSEAREDTLNFIKSYHEKHGKSPSLRTITDSLENVSKRKFYEIFPDGVGDACRQAGVGADQKRIESTKKARKIREDKPPRPALTPGEAERAREDRELLALKPEVFRLMRGLGVDTPGEALKQAEALVTAMNPWVLNYGVESGADLVALLVKERATAIENAKAWKAESEKQKDDAQGWREACMELAKHAATDYHACKVLSLNYVTRCFFTVMQEERGFADLGVFLNSTVEQFLLDRGFGWEVFGQELFLYRHGALVERFDLEQAD